MEDLLKDNLIESQIRKSRNWKLTFLTNNTESKLEICTINKKVFKLISETRN